MVATFLSNLLRHFRASETLDPVLAWANLGSKGNGRPVYQMQCCHHHFLLLLGWILPLLRGMYASRRSFLLPRSNLFFFPALFPSRRQTESSTLQHQQIQQCADGESSTSSFPSDQATRKYSSAHVVRQCHAFHFRIRKKKSDRLTIFPFLLLISTV